jgi:transposase
MLEPLAPRALVGKTVPMPDPEVRERPLRRRFTAEYKRRIVEEANAVSEPGAVGALLRREGLYSSHLVEWRRLYRAGIAVRFRQPARSGCGGPAPRAARSRRRSAQHLRARSDA